MFCMLDLGGCSVWRLVLQGLEFRGLGFKGVCKHQSPRCPSKDRIWAVCALLSLAGGAGNCEPSRVHLTQDPAGTSARVTL